MTSTHPLQDGNRKTRFPKDELGRRARAAMIEWQAKLSPADRVRLKAARGIYRVSKNLKAHIKKTREAAE